MPAGKTVPRVCSPPQR